MNALMNVIFADVEHRFHLIVLPHSRINRRRGRERERERERGEVIRFDPCRCLLHRKRFWCVFVGIQGFQGMHDKKKKKAEVKAVYLQLHLLCST